VVQYLRASINHLATTQFRVKKNKRTLDPAVVSSRLVDVLPGALSSEREQDLERLMVKFSRLQAEKQRLEAEHLDIHERTEREASRDTEENRQLEQEHRRLAEEMKTIKHRYESREEAYRTQVGQKKAELQSLRRVIEIMNFLFQNSMSGKSGLIWKRLSINTLLSTTLITTHLARFLQRF
jgi:chromosome segregation ATPase